MLVIKISRLAWSQKKTSLHYFVDIFRMKSAPRPHLVAYSNISVFLGTRYNNALRNHINNAHILSHIYNYPPDINMSQLLLDSLWFQLKSR